MLYRCAVHVTHKSAFSPLHYRDIDAVGGTSCDAFRGDPKVSWASELCSGCRLYPSQSHLQLERAGSEKKKSNRGIEKKRQSYRNWERRAGSVSTPGWWIYCGMISLFWEVDDGWDVTSHNVSAEKPPFTGGSAQAGWQMMWSVEPLHLTSHRQASMMGIHIAVSKVGRRNLLWNSLSVLQGQQSHTASVLLSRARRICAHSICLPIFLSYIFLLFLKHTYFSFQTEAWGDWLCPDLLAHSTK